MRQYTEEFKREIAELVIRSGKSQAQISRETGISNQNISRWVKEYKNNSNIKTEAQGPGWQEYHALQEDLRRVREERDILKKSVEHFLPERVKRYAFIEKYQNEQSVVMLCKTMKIKRGSYYAWKRKGIGKRSGEDEELKSMIESEFETSKETYGTRRLMHKLKRKGFQIGRRRIGRLMKEKGLKAKRSPKWHPPTTQADPRHEKADNLLEQDFQADAPPIRSG